MNSQFKKGLSGNPNGRPKGSNKVSNLRAAILDELPNIIAALLIQAKAGDIAAAKLLLDRAMPTLKPQVEPVAFDIAANGRLSNIGQSIIEAILRAELAPDVGSQLIMTLAAQSRLAEIKPFKLG